MANLYWSLPAPRAGPPSPGLVPVLLHGGLVDGVDVPGTPVDHGPLLCLPVPCMVLVDLVTRLGSLELVVHCLAGLLTDNGQPPAQPVEQGLQVTSHHVQLPRHSVLQLQGGLTVSLEIGDGPASWH